MSMIRHWVVLIAALLPFDGASGAPPLTTLQFSARFINSPAGQASLIVADRAGNLFVISNVCAANPCPPTQPSTIQVTRTDLSGNVLGGFSFGGSGSTVAYAAAIDKAGNLVLGGSTSSPDFPLLSPLQTTGGAFLTKIDPVLHGIVYSTRFGSPNSGVSVKVSAIAVGGDGNTYLTGTTYAGLPVTPGAFQTQGSVATNAASAYVAEISASGSTLVFATYYSGTLPANVQGIPLNPIAYAPVTSPSAILVDSAGDIVVAGHTTDNVPVTPGAYSMAAPTNALGPGAGFAAKFKPGGTGLVWGTYLPQVVVSSMAQDSAGNLVLAGLAVMGFATTADSIQPSFPQAPSQLSAGASIERAAGFLLKLASTGDKLINASYFGGNVVVSQYTSVPILGVNGLALDESGDIWITGDSAPVALPSNSGPVLGQNYIAEISPDLETVLALNSVPDGGAGVAIASAPGGTLATLGRSNLLLLTNPGVGSSVLGIGSSPGFRMSSVIAPTELVTLYGIGIGPAAGQVAQIGSDGVIGNVLGGTQVLFNGTAAALLYAGPSQINAIVPEAVRGIGQTSIQVVTPTATIVVAGMAVQDYAPTLFGTIGGVAAPAVNEDGTINGPSNPAPLGSIVAVWLTGLGSAAGFDNEINPPAPWPSQAPVSVLSYGQGGSVTPLTVLYAGDAPDLPSGVSQINFRLPTASVNGVAGLQSFGVQVGSLASLPFLIYLQ